ncbi:unnamed protein product [Chironomus riparius]|uniref:Kelch-like protein diablo n=1 Tax=Chironomus riparius TaxID=315576 RepID=A0A9N9RSP5_9DIPT|nr:unnamed protein product [Chironomus riparius]
MQNFEISDVNFDDRKKKYDMNAIHFQKTMAEISKLRSKSLLFDIVIKTGDKSFQAHKLLLAASSDYFRAMFTANGKILELEKSEIQIDGISAVGIENVLNFIYTAKLELSLMNVQEVLSAANYFQLPTVIDACLNFLEGELDTENCIDMLIIAENYSLISLRDKILKFICAHISEISKSEEFLRLQDNQIEKLLSCDLPVDCTETEILRITLTWLINCRNDLKNLPRILRNINFKEIPVNEAEKVMKALEIKRTDPLYTAVWSQTIPFQNSSKSSNDNKLLNHRGMELAIIKIGGFEMTGITNEITYSFPSFDSLSLPSIQEPWRYLTEIPHIKQGSYGISVLNNCIYVIGGSYDINLDNEDVHPFGFKYNPLTSEWSTIKPMNFDRCRFSLNVIEGSLIAVGGHSEGLFQRHLENNEGQNVATAERYDVNTDSWTILTSLPEYRSQHAGVSYEKILFISGGIDHYGNVLESFYQYDNSTDRWTKICNLTPRADHVMLRVDKKIYICGGWNEIDGQRRLVSAIECYDMKTSTISTITNIHTPRFHAGITLINNKIYVIGGFATDDIFRHTATKIEIYDIIEDKWYFPDKYPKHVWEHSLTTIYIPKEVEIK